MRRAAKYADGFTAPNASRRTYDSYVEQVHKAGKSVGNIRFGGGYTWLICSNDPDKTFNEAAYHIIYQTNLYTEWAAKAGQNTKPVYLKDRAHLRETGQLKVAEPAGCIKIIRDYVDQVPVTHFYSWTLPPGLPAKWAQEHLELFAAKVIPAFR